MTQIVEVSEAAGRSDGYRRSYRSKSRYGRRSSRYGSRRPKRRKKRVAKPKKGKPLSKFVRAQINPFDDSVAGVKIPDSNTCPSGTVQITDSIPVTTDAANGTAAMLFNPYLVSEWVTTGLIVAPGAWPWQAAYAGGTDSTRKASVSGNYVLYRPVSHGIKIFCPQNASDAKGFLHICVIPISDFTEATWAAPINVSQMTNSLFYQRVPISNLTQQGLTVVNKFLDCTCQRYIDVDANPYVSSAAAEFHTPGWCTILVAVEGCANATTVLNVETMIHIEAIPLKTGLLTSSPAAPYSVGDMTNVSHLAGQQPAAYLDAQYSQYVKRAIAQIGRGVKKYGPGVIRAGRQAYDVYQSMYGGVGGVTDRGLYSPMDGLLTM
jgi:hypothetical protein